MNQLSETKLRLTLGVLMLVYMFNYLDRQIVAILAEPIAQDLGLNDTQIGVMTGLAFALFYTVLGLPIARYADRPRTNRVRVIALAVAVWSTMTAVSGLAQSFAQMLFARIGVGIGEAGGTPPAHSLIADQVPVERRASAMAFYQLGPPIGGLIGLAFGGMLADVVGWRMAFFVVGLPGLVLAAVVLVLLRDPREDRTRKVEGVRAEPHGASTREACREMFASRAMRRLLLVAAAGPFASYGIIIWATIFFQRSHGLSPGQTGLWFGLASGIGCILAVWLGGKMGDKALLRGKEHIMTLPAITKAASAPVVLIALLVSSWQLSMALFFVYFFLSWLHVSPFYAVVQGLVPSTSRAIASATILFMQNLIGLGLGPVALGFVSDLLKPQVGGESVRYVLFVASFALLFSGWMLWSSRKFIAEELGRYD